jgi:type I restriction enzyme, S subunit
MSAAAMLPPVSAAFLRFVRFTGLNAWAYEAIFAPEKAEPTFPTVALGEVIRQRKGFIRIDDGQTYMRCRVQWRGQGVELRDSVCGKQIKTKNQQLCNAGDLLVAEIDAKMGGFGIVPDRLQGAVVSSHYFLFEIDVSRLNRDYLGLYLTTEYFQQQVRPTGSTNYSAIRPLHVLGYHLPLPSLPEQEKLVAKHRSETAKAEAAELQARATDAEVIRFLESSLGLKPRAEKTRFAAAKLYFSRFATLERWGDLFLGATDEETSSKYSLVRLGEVIADLQNGWSPKCHDRPANDDEWGVLKLGAVSFGTYNEAANKALPANFKANEAYEVKQGDVLISRGNALSLVGAAVHVKATRLKLMMPDLVFRAVWKKNSPVLGSFLAEVMLTRYLRHQIESVATGTSPSMKKVTKPSLFNLRFPLPPLPEQERIVTELDRLRTQARSARATAAASRESAAQGFHAALFAPV